MQTATAQNIPSLYLYNWADYIAPNLIPVFETNCKCRLVQDYYTDNEEMLAKLAAGAVGYDLIVPSGNAVEALIKQNALLPLDYKQLPNLKNINLAFRGMWFDPKNAYSIPYAYTTTFIGYNAEKMKELGIPTDTWAAIFEPRYLEKLKGRVTVLDSQREVFAAAMRYLGYSLNDTDPQKWRQAKDIIIRAKPYWAAFNTTTYKEALTKGTIWLAHGYSSEMYIAQRELLNKKNSSFHIEYSIPKEGAVVGVDNLVIHKAGKHHELAHQFINFMLDGRNAAQLTNLIGSGNPNSAAMQYIQPSIVHNPNLFPDSKQYAKLEMPKDLDRRQRRLLNRLWIEIKMY